jgi:hypothetical protein
MEEKNRYEAPRIRDLEELGVEGQFPLGGETCSEGTGGLAHGCTSGTGTTGANAYCTSGVSR